MNQEKVLALLNLDQKAKKDNFMGKVVCGFNFGFTLLSGALILSISISRLNIAFAFSFVLIDFLLSLVFVLYKNPAWQFVIENIGMFFVVFKLLIGFIIISKDELINKGFPIFTWVHLVVAILAVWLTVYVLYKLFQAYMRIPVGKALMI